MPALIAVLALACAGYYQYNKSTVPANKQSAEGKRGKKGFGNEDALAVVAIETVKQTDFPVILNGLGTVTALRTVTVRPRVDGELIRVAFTEGQMVKQGDLLAEIDPRPYQNQLQQAQGQLIRDEALLKNAQIDQQRYQTLLEQDSIAAQQTVTQEAQVRQYRGVVEMDKAQVNTAKLQLDYARLTAPISGRIGLRLIDQGNIVQASSTAGLAVITQLQPISVVFTLPEDKVKSIAKRLRTKEQVAVAAYDRSGNNKLADGLLTAIDNQIDATTGTLKLKAQFDNADGSLFANQFVNMQMLLETLHNVNLISTAASQHDNDGDFLYVIKPDKTVEVRRVTLGASYNDKVVVLTNLAANEWVVVEGADRLKAGKSVDIAKKDGNLIAADPKPPTNPEQKQWKK